MQHIAAAGQLLAAGDDEQAKQMLTTAAEILTQIGSVFEQEGKPGDAERMIPVYARLGIVEGVEVTEAMKQGLNDLAPMVAASQHAQVVERLKSFGVGLSYSYVELPLDEVSEQVNAALKALGEGDQQAAKKYLAAANEVARMETVNVGFDSDAEAAQSVPTEGDAGDQS